MYTIHMLGSPRLAQLFRMEYPTFDRALEIAILCSEEFYVQYMIIVRQSDNVTVAAWPDRRIFQNTRRNERNGG